MKQLYNFSRVDRYPAYMPPSVGYCVFIAFAQHVKSVLHEASAKWFSIKKASKIIFDYERMVERALARLAQHFWANHRF